MANESGHGGAGDQDDSTAAPGIGCMDSDPGARPAQLQRIAELTPSRGAGLALSAAGRALLERAVEPHTLAPDGTLYTSPRSYGVYELRAPREGTARFHFGNHPVRQRELEREQGGAKLIAVFLDRADAKALTELLKD